MIKQHPTANNPFQYQSVKSHDKNTLLLPLLHTFNGLFSRTIWVSRHQKGKTILDSNQARDGGVLGWQWHQLDHMQTICTCSRQITTSTPHHSIFTDRMLFPMPNQLCQSIESNTRQNNTSLISITTRRRV